MSRLLTLSIVIASVPAAADRPFVRPGAMIGLQQTDRSAWVFGPSLEVAIFRDISIRGEAQLELGDIEDPFGDSNILSGDGPHVNHVLFGPTWRPASSERYQLAVGAEAGVLVMHSRFAEQEFTKRVAAGLFVQAGRMLGPVSIALQLRLDLSSSVAMGNRDGGETPTTSGRLNLVFEVPISLH